MKQTKNQITRREWLGSLGLLLAPLSASAVSEKKDTKDYQILLKPDGTTVKVASASVKKSKLVKKKLSNKGLYEWLKVKR